MYYYSLFVCEGAGPALLSLSSAIPESLLSSLILISAASGIDQVVPEVRATQIINYCLGPSSDALTHPATVTGGEPVCAEAAIVQESHLRDHWERLVSRIKLQLEHHRVRRAFIDNLIVLH